MESALVKLGGFGRISIDGMQSAADCAAIKRFQTRFDLRPVDGIAGPSTLNVAERLLASKPSRCDADWDELTACVDLTNQTVWLMHHGEVVYGPTVTRTGIKKYATPTGTYEIDDRNRRNWSSDYKVWLPYYQHLVRGIGFHQTTTYIHNSAIGSHGCINLLPVDAVALWNRLEIDSTVKIFGRRPGT